MGVAIDRWTALRRSTPDPSASSTPSLPSRIILRIFGGIAIIITILFQFPLTIARHFIFGPLLEWMPLSSLLLTRYLRLFGAYIRTHLPQVDPSEWDILDVSFKALIAGSKGESIEMVRIPPLEDRYRQGFTVCDSVESVERPGFMLTPPGSAGHGTEEAKPGERAVLYFHGGAYTVGHPLQYPFTYQVSKTLRCRLFAANYRKTLNTTSAFPAPLLDALAAYLYLTQTLHFEAQNILLIGDSAGGHLSLALSRYLSDLQPSLAQPGKIALSSPWCDWTSSFPSKQANASYDYLSSQGGELAISSATRYYTVLARTDAYFSASLAAPGQFGYLAKEGVKVYVQIGTREGLADEGRSLVAGMKRDGVDVKLTEVKDGLHDDAVAQWPGSPAWPIWKKAIKEMMGVSEDTGDDSVSEWDRFLTQLTKPLGP